jgi:putative selenate reductase
MAEKFAPLEARRLLAWILAEEQRGQIFGIHRELFFQARESDPFRMRRFGKLLETPLGVAAGPHTQLAQNIVSAWLCGARFIELKTVQTLDQLLVSKPCISMAEVGFNCEWSQELTLDESFKQYLAAWVLLHLLRFRQGPFSGDPGFIFNLSVGYDLSGIMQPNMQRFFDRMFSCRSEKEALLKEIEPLFPALSRFDIPDRMSDNATLSTMHGCPPEEIEKIGLYLLNEKKLHTTVKLNPTLLGAKRLRSLLNDTFGWKVEVPDQAFDHDLRYDAALDLIRSLQTCAKKNGLHFGVKLTNTLECLNRPGLLPEKEKTVYMSGRPLHPLAVALAKRLQDDFKGKLAISFSGGVDPFNAADLLSCGLKPLTVCSDILQPGGYARLGQYLEEIGLAMDSCGASSLDELVLKKAKVKDAGQAVMKNLKHYEVALEKDESYQASLFPAPSFKGGRALDWFDCAAAPCRENCAVGQDVSRYMDRVGANDAAGAAAVIWATNPLPSTSGMVCDQKCRLRCTRGLFDQSLSIRAVKRFAIENGELPEHEARAEKTGKRVAVIGAGPSGLAVARDLSQAGFQVVVFEAESHAGGLAASVIPGFRLGAAALAADIARLDNLGVIFYFDQPISRERLNWLLESYDFVYLACGAGKGRKMLIPGEDATGVFDALEFLAVLKGKEKPDLGKEVVVIGGGNSAMDAARSARRLVGPDGRVMVVYRRSLADMPATGEEVQEALAEGVGVLELAAPLEIRTENGRVKSLRCAAIELGAKDESGRPRPVPVPGYEFELPCDSVIVAVGQGKNSTLLDNQEWRAVGSDGRTTHPRLFIGGDAKSGAASLIKAVADGSWGARMIGAEKAGPVVDDPPVYLTWTAHQLQRAHRERFAVEKPAHAMDLFTVPDGLDAESARREARRCLHCDDQCLLCVSVCPNRALVAFATTPLQLPVYHAAKRLGTVELSKPGIFTIRQRYQLVHVVDFCNECGNCAVFCPTRDAPYKNKPHFFLSQKEFDQAAEGFFLERSAPGACRALHARRNGELQQLRQYADRVEFENRNCLLKLQRGSLNFQGAEWRQETDPVFDGQLLAQMAVLVEFVPEFLQGE